VVAYNIRVTDALRSSDYHFDKIDIAAAGDSSAVVIPAVAGKQIVVIGGLIICSAAITLNLEDGAGLDFTGGLTLGTDAKGFAIPPDPTGQFVTGEGEGLVINYNGTAQISGWLKWKVM